MNVEQNLVVLPEGRTNHAELEALGFVFGTGRKGRKDQTGILRRDGKIVACCRLSNQGFAELIG